jgi:hypothetical protein
LKVIRKSFNPWVVVFLGTAIFHIWRGSIEDVLIFGSAAALILVHVFGLTRFGFLEQPKVPVWLIATTVSVSALLLYVSPRHETVNFLVLLVFIPVGIALLMYRDSERQGPPAQAVRRSRLAWGIWAVSFALVELVAYVSSKITQDLGSFPTISVLLDPVLDEPLGRAVFVAIWLIAGVYLFGVRRKP